MNFYKITFLKTNINDLKLPKTLTEFKA